MKRRKPKPVYPPHPPGERHERRPAGWLQFAMANPLEWLKAKARWERRK